MSQLLAAATSTDLPSWIVANMLILDAVVGLLIFLGWIKR